MKNQLKAKDLITLAIFSVVYMVTVFACSATFGMIPLVYPFIVPIGMIPCGIVWAYLRAKLPKRFCILIQCVIQALLMFLVGTGWFVAAGVLVGGIVAEFVSAIGKYKNFKISVLAYALYGFCFNFGAFSIIMLAKDYYRDWFMSSGGNEGFMNALLDFMGWPVLGITSVMVFVSAIIGMLLGKTMLKKHFVKAGIV
jgi:energy-coupling factor transport system substrate-specific component